MRKRSWTVDELKKAVQTSRSIRQILTKIGLREAGGNYKQVKKYIKEYNIDTSHLKGRGWSKNIKVPFRPKIPLKKLLVRNSGFQTFKLKGRLIFERMKKEKCEICDWSEKTPDGRIPLELDHINGDSRDHRLHNLRILCPNCHSLQPTHRGRNRN